MTKIFRYFYKILFLVICFCTLVSAADEPSDSAAVFPIQVDWLAGQFAFQTSGVPQGLFFYGDSISPRNSRVFGIDNWGKSEMVLSNDGTHFIITQKDRTSGADLLLPSGMSITEYYDWRCKSYYREEMASTVIKAAEAQKKSSGGGKIELIGADIAGQRVSLQVSGNININGKLQNQKRSQVASTFQEDKSTSFIIDQKQQLDIEGKIGDRISILVDQDSERDFDFENNMRIVYTGEEDEIVQKVQAGNISLSLPGTQFVTFSGKNNGLFGFKTEMKFGGINVTAIASVEKGKKEKLSIDGGAQKSAGVIEDYEYRKNTYFYLDSDFRESMYKDFSNHPNKFDPYVVDGVIAEITDLNLYLSVSQQYAGTMRGVAYVDPNHPDEYVPEIEDRYFKRLVYNQDYYYNKNLGFIKMLITPSEGEVLAAAYRVQNEDTTKVFAEYGDWNHAEGDTSDIILKIIKPESNKPSHPCWDLEFKNVYYLGTSNINKEGFELDIVYKNTTRTDVNRDDEGVAWISKFGVDVFNVNNVKEQDELIDVDNGAVINLQSGELWLPYLKPFTSGVSDIGESNAEIDTSYDCSGIYTSATRTVILDASQFQITYAYENRSSIIQLGPMVIEGSEVVTLNGQTLTKGSDYNIDYFTGTLTMLKDEATTPDASLDVKYEKNQFFQLDKKTIMGVRAEYDVTDNFQLGATALYYSKSVVDEKVDVGYEPYQNFIWDMNGMYNRELGFLTDALDRLPVIETNTPSKISFEGEIAGINPNPNTLNNEATGDYDGVAFIDDFESSKKVTSAPILRRYWTLSSAPLDELGNLKDDGLRGKVNWYNSYGGIPTKSIWPNKQTSTQAQNSTTEVMRLKVNPKWARNIGNYESRTAEEKMRTWGGITYFFPASYYDQTSTKFFEIWIQGESGTVHIDLGSISEDQYRNGELNTEDLPVGGMAGNDLLDDGEDTGLDGLFDEDETVKVILEDGSLATLTYGDARLSNYLRSPKDPHDDNWDWTTGSTDYDNINGTEGNSNDANGLYPDSEDRDNDYNLDTKNDYMTVTFDLSDENDPYYDSYTVQDNGTPTGWKLYRVPVSEFKNIKSDGTADWESIKACRIWMDGVDKETLISIAKVELVGNEWEELGVAKNELNIKDSLYIDDDNFAISIINTEDDAIYEAPKGVEGEYDRVNEIRTKEQSLVIRLLSPGLFPDKICVAEKNLSDVQSYLSYKKMKMFVNGHEIQSYGHTYIGDEKTPLNIFLRFGFRIDKVFHYYEYRAPIYPGWHKNNEMELDLDFLTTLKTLENEEDYDLVSSSNSDKQEFFIEYDSETDLEHRIYKETKLIDGQWKYTGKEIHIYGNPMLSKISKMHMGLLYDAKDATKPVWGDVWVDELRLSEVRKDMGIAYRAKAAMNFADIASFNVNVNRKDADFHTASERTVSNPGSLNNSQSLSMSGKISLNKFMPDKWGLSIPVSGSYTEKNSTPKYLPTNQDVLVGESAPDSIQTVSHSYGVNTSFNKREGERWYTKYTIDQVKASFSAKWSDNSSPSVIKHETVSYSGKVSYQVPFGRDKYFAPFKWAESIPIVGSKMSPMKIYYMPNKLSTNISSTESKGNKVTRAKTQPSYTFSANTSVDFGYKLLDNLNVSASRTDQYNLSDFRADKMQILEEFSMGSPIIIKENYNATFNPKIISWFTPNLTYRSSFTWSHKIPDDEYLDNLANQNGISASANLKLSDILGVVYKPKGKQSGRKTTSRGRGTASTRGTARGTTRGKSNKQEPKTEEEKPKKEIKVLDYLYNGLDKVQPLSVSYNVNTSVNNRYREVKMPGMDYRFGFNSNPGLDTLGNMGSSPDIETRSEDYSLRSGLKIMNNLSTTFSYSHSSSETNSSGDGNSSMNHDYFALGKDGSEGFPFPSYSVRWTGLQKYALVGKVFSSLSLDHGMSGKESKTFRNGEVQSSTYRKAFQPLVGASMEFKNKMSGSARYAMSNTINNQNASTSITSDQSASASLSWKKKGGMNIPLPFLKKKRLENQITFQMSFDYSHSETKSRNNATSTDGKYATTNKTTTWKVAPKINYSFTEKVSGGIYFQYDISEAERTGKRRTMNGGFDVNIKIRG